jgi:hypothetical protein
VNDRQRYALAQPVQSGHADLAPYTADVIRPDGNLLRTILAVDR